MGNQLHCLVAASPVLQGREDVKRRAHLTASRFFRTIGESAAAAATTTAPSAEHLSGRCQSERTGLDSDWIEGVTMTRSHEENITLIQQQVRVISAMLEVEDDDHVANAMSNQKSAFEWVLEIFGAEPADTAVIPPLNEPEYNFMEFRNHCEANGIPLGSVDVEFIKWLYSDDNSMNRPAVERDTSSFVLDSVLNESNEDI